jgi:HEAT repeats
MKRRISLGVIAMAGLLLALGAWLERTQLRAWYYVHELAGADSEHREFWIAKVAGLEEASVFPLIACLSRSDEQACDNATKALEALVRGWGLDDLRTISLSCRLADAFPTLSSGGQAQVLILERAWFRPSENASRRPTILVQGVGRLLIESSRLGDSAVRQQALRLADDLLPDLSGGSGKKEPQPHLDTIWMLPPEETSAVLDACRQLIRAGLKDAAEPSRIYAIRLAQRPGLNSLAEVVPLLRDSSAEVRRAAILAVGPAPEVISDDDLLYWLNDPAQEVQQLCEIALRARGLQENHIRLARLITDRRPSVRMQIFENLKRASDLEPGVWLRRLSHDPAPAIRAAAARAAAHNPQADLADRMTQMAQNDPSPTVQQLARYYLSCQQLRAAQSE